MLSPRLEGLAELCSVKAKDGAKRYRYMRMLLQLLLPKQMVSKMAFQDFHADKTSRWNGKKSP